MMQSIKNRQLDSGDDSRPLRSEFGGLLDLCLPTAMRRVPHFLLAVALTRSDLRRFDLLLHKLMGGDIDGPLRASYYAKAAYTCETADSLDKILSNDLLPDVIYEFTIRLEDNRRSLEVSFSRKGVVTRVMGGAFDEFWEAESQKAVSAFLAEKRAKFLIMMLALVLLLLGGSFYLMYVMAFESNGLNAWMKFFYAAYISVSFSSSILFWMHQRGVLFPHAKIAIRDRVDGAGSGNKALVPSVLSLIIQVIRLIADYFFVRSHRARNLVRRRPADATQQRGIG